jgi:hypothetical protein
MTTYRTVLKREPTIIDLQFPAKSLCSGPLPMVYAYRAPSNTVRIKRLQGDERHQSVIEPA